METVIEFVTEDVGSMVIVPNNNNSSKDDVGIEIEIVDKPEEGEGDGRKRKNSDSSVDSDSSAAKKEYIPSTIYKGLTEEQVQTLKANAHLGFRALCSIKVEFDKEKVHKLYGLKVDLYSVKSCCYRMDLARKRYCLIDLSGTLHVEDEMTPKAVQSLVMLRDLGYKLLFVTNTTKESKKKLHERLTKIGFKIELDELYTSMDATRNYLIEKGLRAMLLVADEAMEDFEGVDTTDPNCVVIGLARHHFNREKLSEAMRLIMKKEDTELIAVHKGRRYKTSTGMSMGPGGFVVGLELATGKSATVLGKPDQKFYEGALKAIGCENPQDAIMFGDDVMDDVYGAMRAGITGVLVKTGKYIANDEKKIDPYTPDFTFDNFSEAVKLMLERRYYNIR